MTNHASTIDDFEAMRRAASRRAASAGRGTPWRAGLLVLALHPFVFYATAAAQGPDWLLPLGASLSPTEAKESPSLPSRLPPVAPARKTSPTITSVQRQEQTPRKPGASGQRQKYPTRLPVPSAAAQPKSVAEQPEVAAPAHPFQLAEPAAAGSSARSSARLLPPRVEPEVVITVPRESLFTTAYDRNSFDRSIEASLASSRSTSRIFLPPVDCESSLTTPCRPCNNAGQYYDDFSPTPIDPASIFADPSLEQWAYDAKRDVPTQHPWIEWGREFYGNGITPRGRNWFGEKNLARPKFYLYGDYRSGIATGRNASGRIDNWANRLNLESDLQLTDTERFHAFVGPLDNGGQFSRWELVEGDLRYRSEIDFTPVTGFFEGDAGVLLGALQNRTSPFELPITIGLVPLLFQNGIWMEDAVTGAAFSLPARHSRLLNWSNFDATFFAVVDQLNSPAFVNEHAAQAFGTAWFIEAYDGYIETGYAYVRDRNVSDLSYHNITTSYTRRYFDRISNSLRVIVNTGQDLPDAARTADGVLLLVENSWITPSPLTVVPYANFFVGWDRPQSVARAGVSGGILRNTGINFETDALNGYPTLDPTGHDTAGGTLGIDLIGNDLNRQLLLEMAYLTPHGSKNLAVPGDQFAVGARYSVAISNWSLLRLDTMYGWRRGLHDLYGTRMEYRWKF